MDGLIRLELAEDRERRRLGTAASLITKTRWLPCSHTISATPRVHVKCFML